MNRSTSGPSTGSTGSTNTRGKKIAISAAYSLNNGVAHWIQRMLFTLSVLSKGMKKNTAWQTINYTLTHRDVQTASS